jgi:hypothetical protein
VSKHEQNIQQTSTVLPYFHHEVPLLLLEDGTSYIPVAALCHMFGLHAGTYVPRWRKSMLWRMHAKKLPCSSSKSRTWPVWCLRLGDLPFWCGCFDWSLTSLERQEQLHQATKAWCEALEQIHLDRLSHDQRMCCLLIEFLTAYEHLEAKLSSLAGRLHPLLDRFDLCLQFEELLAQGKALIQQATDHARHMLQKQRTSPVADAIKLDKDGHVLEELSLPLFPVFLEKDCTTFFTYVEQLSQWYQQLTAFLQEQDILLNDGQELWDITSLSD